MTEDTRDWRIRETDANWECDWNGSERFHVRCFRALPMQEKLEAVEEMCRFVETYRGCAVPKADSGSGAPRGLPASGGTGPSVSGVAAGRDES